MQRSTATGLRELLVRLDRRPYPAYKDIKGRYDFGTFELFVDHVQGDPFASPSRLRVRVPRSVSGWDGDLLATPSRRRGVCHVLALEFGRRLRQASGRRGSGKSGALFVDEPGQQMLETTAVVLGDGWLEARFFAGLPAAGRRILGRQAADMLCRDLPEAVEAGLTSKGVPASRVREAALAAEDADAARRMLPDLGLVAFVADGAILPRRSGVDDRPLEQGAVPFESPESLRVTLELPNRGPVTGMGIPEGVTLIVGGGFHGKSTLLSALERGVYDHRPGDGRELVVTVPWAVKVRAEDGRSVANVDISAFIADLPGGQDTRDFSTQNASGSTSQAANIVEALEAGARLLLLDEDTCATNFMIRDERMQELVAKEAEPITPFVDKVRLLSRDLGVSTVLVMGGSGDYFDVADTVVAMEAFRPKDVTARAKEIVRLHPTRRRGEGGASFGRVRSRAILPESLDPSKGKRAESVKSRGLKTVLFGTHEIDLSAVEQLVHPGQLRAIGSALLELKRQADGRRTLPQLLDWMDAQLDRNGLLWLGNSGDLARFRRYELAAALNRLRTLRARLG